MVKRVVFLYTVFTISLPSAAQPEISTERLEQHVFTLASDSLLGRGFGTEQGSTAARYIADQFKEAGIEPLNGDYFHSFNYRTGILNIAGTNVTGIIHGNDPDLVNEYIIMGAHYDHLGWKISDGDTVVYNGADDNASGTASIIEIGRNLVFKKESLGRSIIIVAFDGEESGLIGSKQFLADGIIPPEQIKLMFSLDMVGMYKAHGGLDLEGINLLPDVERITGELANKDSIIIRKANRRIEQRTDTAPFGNRGIPAIAPNTGTESPYHKPEDRAELLDYDGMALIAGYITDVTSELSNSEVLSEMTFTEGGKDEASGSGLFRKGLRINLGSGKHNYPGEFYNGKSVFSAGAGMFASIRATSFLTVQPEVLYETTGSQHARGTFRTHSVTTPLNLLITSPESVGVRTYFRVGGYYCYHFGGKVGNVKIDFQDEYANQEYGIVYGFGLEIMNVQMGLNIQRGLSGLNRDPDASGMSQESIYFGLGFTF